MLGIDIYLAAQTYSVIGSEPNVNNYFFSVHGLGLIYPIYRTKILIYNESINYNYNNKN